MNFPLFELLYRKTENTYNASTQPSDQDKLTFIFFEEALSKMAGGTKQKLYEIKKNGLEIFKNLEQEKNELEDKLKAKKIEESLQKSE